MDNRNKAWANYVSNPNQDNHREYNHLKAQVKKSLIAYKADRDKRSITEAVNSKNQWKEAKNLIGWTSYGGPKMLIVNGKPITSPNKMANQLTLWPQMT